MINPNKYINRELVHGRECGDCTACCVLPRIQDRPHLRSLPLVGDKPGYTPCRHLGPCGGCGVYGERPQVCREFQCLWRDGNMAGDDRRRPDNLGLMLVADVPTFGDGKPWIDVWELWDGAATNHPGRGVLDAMYQLTRRVMVRFYGVPCSLQYHGPKTLHLGAELSAMGREAPRELAEWLRHKVATMELDKPNNSADMDLASLDRGEPVVPHFGSKESAL